MVPILLPIIDALGIDRMHFGIVMSYNLLLGMDHSTSRNWTLCHDTGRKGEIEHIVKNILPFYAPMIIALILLSYFPQLSLWLPSLLFD